MYIWKTKEDVKEESEKILKIWTLQNNDCSGVAMWFGIYRQLLEVEKLIEGTELKFWRRDRS